MQLHAARRLPGEKVQVNLQMGAVINSSKVVNSEIIAVITASSQSSFRHFTMCMAFPLLGACKGAGARNVFHQPGANLWPPF